MLPININLDNKTILVTGSAGFIGANLCKELMATVKDAHILGLDSVNDYYDVSIKVYRLNELNTLSNTVTTGSTFSFIKGNIADKELITDVFNTYKPAVVVNLAAQAGVRYSITNPDAYIESNILGKKQVCELKSAA